MSSIPTPPTSEGVPVKWAAMTSSATPTASKSCAPWYERSVEMPILERILRTPLPSA